MLPLVGRGERFRELVVRHSDGRPAAGAVVWLRPFRKGSDEELRTDDAGRARVELERASTVVVTWGDSEAAVVHNLRAGDAGPLEVRLSRAITVRGRVESRSGDTIEGAACRLDWPHAGSSRRAQLHTHTDVAGEFAFGPLPPAPEGTSPWMQVTAPGYVKEWVTRVTASAWYEPLVVRLTRGFRVTGRCIDESGAPRARVRAFSLDSPDGRTNAEGRFVVEGVRPSRAVVVILADDMAPVVLDDFDGVDVDVGDIVLRKGLALKGVFVDATGAPVSGAHVGVSPTDGGHWRRYGRTDDEGRFEVAGLSDVPLNVEADAPGLPGTRSAELEGVRAGGAPVRLELPRGLHAELTFLRADNREPVKATNAHVSMTFTEQAGGPLMSRGVTSSGPDIRAMVVSFDKPGIYDLRVAVGGYETVEFDDTEIFEDRATRLEVLLVPVEAEE